MRIFISLLLAFILPAAIGIGIASIQVKRNVTDAGDFFDLHRSMEFDKQKREASEMLKQFGKKPSFEVVDGTVFDFGAMNKHETKSHKFVVKNTGNAVLTMTLISTSCKCTMSELQGKELMIEPGGETEIELSWKSQDYQQIFEQTATIKTNDLGRASVDLRVTGTVIQDVLPVPSELNFATISAVDPSETSIKVFAFKDPDMVVTGFEWEKKEGAEYFDVNITKMEPSEFTDRKKALAGYRVSLISKPGIPIGLIQQKLLLKTTVENEEIVRIPISGNVKGDISISYMGQEYNFRESINRFDVGIVPKQGAKIKLRLAAKGDDAKEMEVKVAENKTYPEGGISATVEELRSVGSAKFFTVDVLIPGDQIPVSLQGPDQQNMGKLVLETSHPRAKMVVIYFAYAVGR